uniref:Large ribosomal subunit protein uL10m n=1 Tax=Pogona vitticeps TaxID=103695 RepID=A0A6J0SXV1_9SAUR
MAALNGWWGRFCRIGWWPVCQPIRHRSKSITRHFKHMNLVREKLMAITQYIPPKPAIPEECRTHSVTTEQEENGFTRLMYRLTKETFLENKMIVVCHYSYIPGNDMILLRHRLRKYNIHVKFFPTEVMKTFISESKFKNLLPLFAGRSILMVSQELRANEVLRVLKYVPQIVILGACVDDVILSKQGFANFAKLPSLATTQGEVVGALSLMTSQTSILLQRGPVHLIALLEQYVKQQNCEADEAKETGTSDRSEAL